MAFSGGVFSLIAGNPVTTATVISSSWANDTLTDIATNGLSVCLLKDGSQTVTANIPMAGFKFTGLGAGNASGNSIRYEQVNGVVTTAGDLLYATAAGTLARLAIGTAGQVLQTNSGATAPQWASIGSGSTTFLAADVALSDIATYFSGPNTGSIGASGQKWLIMGVATCVDTAGAATFAVRLWNGSAAIADNSSASTAANLQVAIPIHAIVTLSAATTFTLQAKDATATTGALSTSGSASAAANLATSITAIRLT